MKRLQTVIVFIGLLFFTLQVQGQEPENEKEDSPARDYSQLLQGGVSFGYLGYGYVGNRTGFSLPLTAAYEKFFSDHFSGGAFIGYTSYKYQGYSNYSYRWTILNFGPRVSYDYTHILNDVFELGLEEDKFDFYVSLMLLFESRSFSSSDDYYDDYYNNDFVVGFGGVTGVRYKFKNNLAVYGETGYGNLGYLTVGISYLF